MTFFYPFVESFSTHFGHILHEISAIDSHSEKKSMRICPCLLYWKEVRPVIAFLNTMLGKEIGDSRVCKTFAFFTQVHSASDKTRPRTR